MKHTMKEIKQRRKNILNILNHHHKLSFAQLSKLTHVSEMTVRRDCCILANMGKVNQNRGIISLVAPEEIPFSDSISYIKQSLGKEASKYVDDNEIIFVNSSTTAFESIPYLIKKNIRILTNNGYAGKIDSSEQKGKIIFTGGEITRKMIMSNDITIDAFKSMRADCAIIGCAGISLDHGISTPFMEEANVNKMIIKQSKRLIVVADYSKFNVVSNFTVGDISDIDVLITDSFLSNSIVEKFIEAGVRVIQVPII